MTKRTTLQDSKFISLQNEVKAAFRRQNRNKWTTRKYYMGHVLRYIKYLVYIRGMDDIYYTTQLKTDYVKYLANRCSDEYIRKSCDALKFFEETVLIFRRRGRNEKIPKG